MKKSLFVGLMTIPFMGAQCLPGSFVVPFEQETPEITIDLDEQVKKFEDQVNQNGTDTDKATLAALCATESGRDCATPSLPTSIPRSLTLGSETIDIENWLKTVAFADEIRDINKGDVIDLKKAAGVETPDQVEKVTVTGVTITFGTNTMNYPIPPVDVFVGTDLTKDQCKEAKALITDQKVTKFGSLESIPPADTMPHEMVLDDAGKEKFGAALKQLSAAIIVHSAMDFPPAGTEPIAKPTGKGIMTALIKVEFTIKTEGLADLLGSL